MSDAQSEQANGGWFRLDNRAVFDLLPKVGFSAFGVYCYLAARADNQTRDCFPSVERIATDLGVNPRTIQRAVKALVDSGAVAILAREGRSNTYYTPYLIGGDIGVTPINRVVTPESPTPDTSVTPGVTNLSPITRPRELNPLNQTKKKSRALRFDVADMETAEWMVSQIRGNLPEFKTPSTDKWANSIRLMRETDGRTHDQIRHLFAWVQADDFWKAVVLCPDKLREKWNTLTLQSKRTANGNGRSNNGRHGVARVGPGQRYDPDAAARDPNHGKM